ncbi:site-specific integrase [Streptomyces varsoviensis]|uniref:tyrosine-type recombinase/integrase n=1 Tax=Streptomyces varsoviensis TaxID=67373 RepID=UPI0033EF1DB8
MTTATVRERAVGQKLLLLPGEWTHPHTHRASPLERASAEEILQLLPELPHWQDAPTTRSARRQAERRGQGARQILHWLRQHPGKTWQERWFAANGDDRAWIDQLAGGSAVETRGPVRGGLTAGFADLLLLRLITPGYQFLCDQHSVALFSRVTETFRPDLFQRAEKAASDLGMIDRHYTDTRVALAKMLLHTGKDLDELDTEDFLEARTFCMNTTGRQWRGLHGAWSLCASLGILPAQSSLREVLRPSQRPTAALVEDYNIRCKPVRDLLIRYCDEHRPAMDYSSLRNLVGTLAGLFWADLEIHHPGIDSLHLSQEVATAWKERINYTVDTGFGSRPRQHRGRFSILTRVRAFYLDLQQWAIEDPSWTQWAVPCPIRKNETQGASKARKRASAAVHQRIRDRLPHLERLVDTAIQHRDDQRQLLALAMATPIGDEFHFHERGYTRVTTQGENNPWRSQRGGLYVLAEEHATGERLNLTVAEDKAFWAWAIIETLRHTGVRVEELLEITHLALVSHRLPDTGEIVPLLQIVPSKSNQERLLLVPPELASVLPTIIGRVRDGAPHVPVVPRYDHHERTTGPPLPHLFQRNLGWRREVISPTVVRRLLIETLARTGLTDVSGKPLHYTPHDFRRMFATDAVTGGLPVHIAAKILGHDNISTTQHYLAVFDDELIRSYRAFLSNRRSQRPTAEYREPTDAEWMEFQEHFRLRKVELGTCGRPYGTPCNHEHACIRCPMLRVDPQQRQRLIEIIENLGERLQEAQEKGWLGEVQGLKVSMEAAEAKLAALDRSQRTDLGMPTIRPNTSTTDGEQRT